MGTTNATPISPNTGAGAPTTAAATTLVDAYREVIAAHRAPSAAAAPPPADEARSAGRGGLAVAATHAALPVRGSRTFELAP